MSTTDTPTIPTTVAETYETARGEYGAHDEYCIYAAAEKVRDPDSDDCGRWRVDVGGVIYRHMAGGGIRSTDPYEDYDPCYYNEQPDEAELRENIAMSLDIDGLGLTKVA